MYTNYNRNNISRFEDNELDPFVDTRTIHFHL